MPDDRKTVSWRELFEKTVDLGLGAALLTKEAATKLVEDLVKRGSMSKEEGQKFLSDMLEKGKGQKEKMESFVRQTIERILAQADLARQSTVEKLERRVGELEEELKRQRAQAPGSGSDCL
jgi:polyhydroxyalkanoate synthesis regulator phasin